MLQAMERGLGFLRGTSNDCTSLPRPRLRAAPATPKACVELTYRREHYNTCRRELIGESIGKSRRTLTYRGVTYAK